jgi:hypothetical protein
MVRRFRLAAVQGTYAGHGETYLDSKDVLWWSKGGVFKGKVFGGLPSCVA